MNTLLAQTEQVGNTGLNLAIFGAFVAVTMVFVLRAAKTTKTASDMYTAGAGFSGRQNGIAISGDYLSAASFLGIAGAIALTGYDGFLYSVGFTAMRLTRRAPRRGAEPRARGDRRRARSPRARARCAAGSPAG